MKRLYSALLSMILICFVSISGIAQIPNPGFENWTGTEPDGWITNNVVGVAQPIQQSSTSNSGSFSVKGEIVSVQGFPVGALVYSGFPVLQRHAMLTGYYQFNQMLADSLSIIVSMVKNKVGIAAGAFTTSAQTSSWTPFNLNIYYTTGEVPDSAYIYIYVLTSSITTVGSYALIDDLAFSGINDIEAVDNEQIPNQFILKQNYPNPFNPTTNIEFKIPKAADVKLIVYNQLGQTVATLVNERLSANNYSVDWNAEDLPSGIYFYRITAGDFSKTMKLMLMK